MPKSVLVYDTNAQAMSALQAEFPAVKSATLDEAAGADLVFAALHPPVMGETMEKIAGKFKADAVLCSLSPKVKLSTLKEKLGGFGRLARMNPNSPGIIGEGYNPVAFGDGLPNAAREQFLALVKPLGQSPLVAEHLIETYAVISAMGPTYFGFQFAEVAALAKSFGLDDAAARQALRAMLIGTADLLFASDVPQEKALDLVPVRPMAEHEPAIKQMLQTQLGVIFAKLTS
jgi:pyrroline-5-carboxylate reductase